MLALRGSWSGLRGRSVCLSLIHIWVIERGISDGSNPNAAATRQEVWVMLYRMEGNE